MHALTEKRIGKMKEESKWAAYRTFPPQRQTDRSVTARAGRQGAPAISPPESTSSAKLQEES